MRNKKKRTQREEVRKILATMRLELAAQRLAQEQQSFSTASSTMRLDEVIANARGLVTG